MKGMVKLSVAVILLLNLTSALQVSKFQSGIHHLKSQTSAKVQDDFKMATWTDPENGITIPADAEIDADNFDPSTLESNTYVKVSAGTQTEKALSHTGARGNDGNGLTYCVNKDDEGPSSNKAEDALTCEPTQRSYTLSANTKVKNDFNIDKGENEQPNRRGEILKLLQSSIFDQIAVLQSPLVSMPNMYTNKFSHWALVLKGTINTAKSTDESTDENTGKNTEKKETVYLHTQKGRDGLRFLVSKSLDDVKGHQTAKNQIEKILQRTQYKNLKDGAKSGIDVLKGINAVKFQPDYNLLMTNCQDYTKKIWQVLTGEGLKKFNDESKLE